MKILGVGGLAGSGKDAFAAALASEFDRVAFADALKTATRVLFRLTHAQVHGPLEVKEAVDSRWGKSPRYLLQLTGTEVGRERRFDVFEPLGVSAEHVEYLFGVLGLRAGPNCWIEALTDRVQKNRMTLAGRGVVVPDVRFGNEAAAIRKLGGLIVRVDRPGVERRHTHASEALDFDPERVVLNDGSLEDLAEKARVIALELGPK